MSVPAMKGGQHAMWWLSAGLLGLAWWVGSLMKPGSDAVYVDLAKLSWEASLDARRGGDPGPALEEEVWHPVKLGLLSEQLDMPATDHELWLRTHLSLPAELEAQDLFIFVGWTYSGVRTLYVNGREVSPSRHDQYLATVPAGDILGGVVPREWMKPGDNSISLRVEYVWAKDTGLTDPRLLLGERRALERFYLLNWGSSQIFRRGALLLLLGFCLVHAVLTRMTRDPALRRAQWLASAWMLTVAILLEASAGELISVLSPNRYFPAALTLVLSGMVGLLASDFFLRYWPAPRARLVFRAVNGLGVGAMLVTWAVLGHAPLITVYLCHAVSLGVLLPVIWVVAVRELDKGGWPTLGTVLLVATVAYIGSASYELVTLGFGLPSYHLFRYGITISAVLTGGVVVMEFLKMGQVNEHRSSELSQANSELSEALDRCRELDRLKTKFLASVTHELRKPLDVIVTVPEALLEDFAPTPAVTCRACGSLFELEAGDNHRATSCECCGANAAWEVSSGWRFIGDSQRSVDALSLLEKSSQHLLAIVNDLLDAGCLEAGHMRVMMHRERLRDVFTDSLALSEVLASNQGVCVVAREELGDTELVCDKVRLVQVVTNLVVNAVRFAGPERRVELDAGIVNGSAFFSVKDAGPGIHPRDQSAIFQIFRQLGEQHHRGAGLGLAIAKQLVELHAGELSVESELGHGATFRVVLPLEPELTRPSRPTLLA